MTLETLITFLTIKNNNINNYIVTLNKESGDSIRNSCDVFSLAISQSLTYFPESVSDECNTIFSSAFKFSVFDIVVYHNKSPV